MELPKLALGKRYTLPRPTGSADALLLARLGEREKAAGRPTTIITADANDAQRLLDEIAFFAPTLRCALFPDWETLPYDTFSPHQDLISERLATLWRISQHGKDSADVTIRGLAGFNVQKQVMSGQGNKEVRARPMAAQAEIGNVKMLRAAWNQAFLDECRMFPNGRNDDQVDAASLAFNKLCLIPRPSPGAAAPGVAADPVPTALPSPKAPFGWHMR